MLCVVLEIKNGNANLKTVELRRTTIIGRSAESGLRIASSEVSRKHCQITISKDRVMIKDLGSSNGTYLNTKRLEPKRDVKITHSASLQIGPMQAQLHVRTVKADKVEKPASPAAVKSPSSALGITDDTVANDKRSQLRAEKKQVDETIPMAPAFEMEHNELEEDLMPLDAAIPMEEDLIPLPPQDSPAIKDDAAAFEQTIVTNKPSFSIGDEIDVPDSTMQIDIVKPTEASDIIVIDDDIVLEENDHVEPTSNMVEEEEQDPEQEIADFLKGLE
jgi:pSer/pThr/pTyr-binding forkhead associated (FHA) protein